ncbi:unnamed protein product [Rhizoctonia solani]|uniref:Uncharacterized protein n=1 Tax=Rhizoctonia solani TaxID=456999 RepID=A0A8H3BXQ1_9AGAM|nr:unnamed protein product [Rhizoctonia solani]
MFFNFALILFWLLAFVAPVGDYTRYLKSFEDTRYLVPDKPMPSVMVPFPVPLASAPAPAPLPGLRFAPLAIPVYYSYRMPQEVPTIRFNRQKPIHIFVGRLIDRFSHVIGRPRPTKTSFYAPTKVPITASAPPTPASRVLEHSSTSTGSTSDLNPVALWSKYKLLVGWVLVTFVITISTFARSLIHGRFDNHASTLNDLGVVTGSPTIAEASLSTFDSILDLYGVPSSSPTSEEFLAPSNSSNLAPEDITLPDPTDDKLITLDGYTNLDGSACSTIASAPFANIDANSQAEGATCTRGTLEGGKTLELGVSISFIASTVGIYARGPLVATPPRRDSHHPSPDAQVHTPQRKRWLEETPLQGTERGGSYHGRTYDSWDDSPGSPVKPLAPAARNRSGTSIDYLPTSVSKDSIDAQMEVMLVEQDQMIFDQELGGRYTPTIVPGLVPAHLKSNMEGGFASTKKLNSADIHPAPNPLVEGTGEPQERTRPNPNQLTTWLALRVVKSFKQSSRATLPSRSPTSTVGISIPSMSPIHTEYQAVGNIDPAHVASPQSPPLEEVY